MNSNIVYIMTENHKIKHQSHVKWSVTLVTAYGHFNP